jgi:two-component system response regulator NreC
MTAIRLLKGSSMRKTIKTQRRRAQQGLRSSWAAAKLTPEDTVRPKIQTVLLNGEHALLRAFLRAWLGRFNYLRVVAESGDAKQAFELVQKHRPSLLLMDFDTLEGASMDLLVRIRTNFPKIKVIIYFSESSADFSVKVIRAGAAGFVLKSADSEDMERAINTVMSGGVYLSPGFLRSLGTAVSREGIYDDRGKALSPRQAEVLKLIALGGSTKAIAFELKISAKTVDVHKQALMTRLGLKSTVSLVKYAIRSGVVPA